MICCNHNCNQGRDCPARVAPIKASYPGVRRECAELGVCQGLTPPCQLCSNHTRDEADAYKVEPFMYWASITLLTAFTVLVGAGAAGYLYQSFS